MNMKRTIVVASLGVMLLTASAGGHHAFSAEFDQDKPVMLEGAVTKADWTNPHAWIYIDVKGPDGKVVNWAIEMGAPNALIRRGITKNTVPIGAELTVEGFAAKDGSPTANGRTLRMADGRALFAGSSNTGAPGDPRQTP